MSKKLHICLAKDFLENLRKYYPKTNHDELKDYIREKIYQAVTELGRIDNGINLRKVVVDVDPKCSSVISIDIDKDSPNYQIAYLLLPPTMIPQTTMIKQLSGNCQQNLTEILKGLECPKCPKYNKQPFAKENLIHELGHLQDVQRKKEFGYTGEIKDLHNYIDIIWNVFLEGRLSKIEGRRNKEKNWRSFKEKLERCKIKPTLKKFNSLWCKGQRGDYTYEEIKKKAEEYHRSSQTKK